MDKVYYINLDHRKDRLVEIEGVLDDLNIPKEKRERIPAVYNPNHGAEGCSRSHIRAVEKFIESGLETCLIFEDDFIYEDKQRFLDSIQYIFQNKIDFDLIQLAYNHDGAILEDTQYPILKKVLNAGTISGILLHRNFAPRLLETYKIGQMLLNMCIKKYNLVFHEYCIDVYWKRLQPQHKWYCFSPRLGYQRESYSDIEKKIVNYKV